MRPLSLRSYFLLLIFLSMFFALSGGACPGSPASSGVDAAINSPLAGTWMVNRDGVNTSFKWDLEGGGEVAVQSASKHLESIDPGKFPQSLQPIVEQWNKGLSELNASLDAALPDLVRVEFPEFAVIRFTDAHNSARSAEGGIDGTGNFTVVGDLSGAGPGDAQGGGATFQASTLQGSLNRSAITMEGRLARTLVVEQLNALSPGFTAHVSVDFTGSRTGG